MSEEDFKIIRDEYIGNVDKFVKNIMLGGIDPKIFHAEMYGSWVRKEDEPDWRCQTASPKKVPICADSIHEKHMIMNRLCTAWVHQPTLTLGQLLSMQFSNMTEIFQAGDYDFIKTIESIRSLDHPKCEAQLKKDRALSCGLRNALEKLSASIDAIDDALNIFAQEEENE